MSRPTGLARRAVRHVTRLLAPRACRRVAPQLSPFVEGGLLGPAAATIAAHLLACRGCRRAHDRVASGVAHARLLGSARGGLVSAKLDAGPPSWDELLPLLDAPPGGEGRLGGSATARRANGLRRIFGPWPRTATGVARWPFAAAAAVALLLTAARGRGSHEREQAGRAGTLPSVAAVEPRDDLALRAPLATAMPASEQRTCRSCHDAVPVWPGAAL
jgi:hypothetical protein